MSVCRLSVVCNVCTVAKRCVIAKVTIDSLQEVVYEKSIGIKMNDLDLCLEVVYGVNHCATFVIEYIGNRYR